MNLNNDKSKKIIVVISSILIVLILMAAFVVIQIGPYNKNNQEDIVIDIPSGSTVNQVSDILKENKLIKNKVLFKLYVRISNNSSNLKSGKYLFNQTYSNKQIINDLALGRVYNDGIKITVPEGSTSAEIINLLVDNNLGEKEVYEKLVSNPDEFKETYEFLKEDDITSLEGFLYPSTYYFDEKESEKEILSHMLKIFQSKYNEKLQKRQKELNKSLYEVVKKKLFLMKTDLLLQAYFITDST